MLTIKVPATSANLGPGFDSIGMAVSLYLTVKVLGPAPTWQVEHDLGALPHDETNLIVQTALQVAPDLTPHHLQVTSEIPVAHGLGSSSSAIVAGIELANQLADLQLPAEQKVLIASQIEGHPDNVAPAILGGLVIGTKAGEKFLAVPAPALPWDLITYIPAYNLATADARAVLPATLSFQEATHASAIANTLAAALVAQQYEVVAQLLEQDQFHEPFRQRLVPELTTIRRLAHEAGAVATYLSGAGPTIMVLSEPKQTAKVVQAIQEAGLQAPIQVLTSVATGVQVERA